jgi:hypothetical protein
VPIAKNNLRKKGDDNIGNDDEKVESPTVAQSLSRQKPPKIVTPKKDTKTNESDE